MERRIVDDFDERDQELVLVADRRDLVVGVEDFLLVQAQRFQDVLVRMRMDRFRERLTQQVLVAFWRRDVAVGARHVVGTSTEKIVDVIRNLAS